MAIRRIATIVIAAFFGIISTACATASPRLRAVGGRASIEVWVDGVRATVYHHRGESYIMGKKGRRYTLRVRNRSARRIEAVVTVDGRDVLDGKPGNWRKRGYLVPAYGSVDIDGWRLSQSSVAAFRFSSVSNAYAAKTGSARNVGVIGLAVFAERQRRPVYVPSPRRYEDSRGAERPDLDALLEDESLAGRSRELRREAAPSRPAPATKGSAPTRGLALRKRASRRPGLGTAFGEKHHSAVRTVSFVRANRTRPTTILGLRYNDRSGLLAMGVDLYPHNRRREEISLRRSASPFPAESRSYAAPPPGWTPTY